MSHSATRSDSEKAEAAGWGAEDGKKELEAEVLAEADAKAEAPAEGAATPVREAPVVEEEEEDNTQTYEEYLAAKAAKKLNISELPEARPANEGEDLFANAQAVTKKSEQEEEWLFGAPVRFLLQLPHYGDPLCFARESVADRTLTTAEGRLEQAEEAEGGQDLPRDRVHLAPAPSRHPRRSRVDPRWSPGPWPR